MLARDLGQPSIRGMLRSMTQDDLRLWQAFYMVDPGGEKRADLRIGILCSLVAAACGDKQAHPAKFMPYLRGEPKRQSVQEQKSVMVGLWRHLSGKQPNT